MRAPAPLPSRPKFIGYARVSTEDQSTGSQLDELKAAGCTQVVQEFGSGASRNRPALSALLTTIGPGETLVVVRLDRLARSVKHLLEVIETLEGRGAHFRSLRDPIDTSTPQGMFSLQVLGAVAQLERALISERTRAGISAARRRGSLPGNPGLRTKDPLALRKILVAKDKLYLEDLIRTSDKWLPTVKRMRPEHRWSDVVSVLNASGQSWTSERLKRSAMRLVRESLLDPVVLKRSPRRHGDDRLITLVSGIAMADPALTLRDIASQLERMRERTPRGNPKWSASSVKNLLDRGQSLGLLRNENDILGPDPSLQRLRRGAVTQWMGSEAKLLSADKNAMERDDPDG